MAYAFVRTAQRPHHTTVRPERRAEGAESKGPQSRTEGCSAVAGVRLRSLRSTRTAYAFVRTAQRPHHTTVPPERSAEGAESKGCGAVAGVSTSLAAARCAQRERVGRAIAALNANDGRHPRLNADCWGRNGASYYNGANNSATSASSKRSACVLPPSSTARASSALRCCRAWIFSSTVPAQISL